MFSSIKGADLVQSTSSSVKMGTSWCIFCLRKSEIKNSIVKDDNNDGDSKSLKVFLKLLRIYINFTAQAHFTVIVGNGTDSLGSCQDCLFLLQEFYKFYCEIKLLEMKLNWRLDMLRAIMTSANKVPSRTKEIEKEFETKNGLFEKLKKFRNEITKKTSAKLKSTYPKVKLERSEPPKLLGPASQPPPSTASILKDLKKEMHVEDSEVLTDPTVDVSETFLRKEEPINGIFTDNFQTNSFKGPTEEVNNECSRKSGTAESGANSARPDSNTISQLSPISDLQGNKCEDEDIGHDDIVAETPLESVFLAETEAKSEPHFAQENEDNDSGWVPDPLDSPTSRSKTELNDLNSVVDASTCVTAEESDVKVNAQLDSPNSVSVLPRRSKRKLIQSSQDRLSETASDSKIAKVDTAPTKDASNARNGTENCDKMNLAPLTLQQLSLTRIMEQKYICTISPCKSTTFCNVLDLKRHSKHHGNFRCKFCDFTVHYAPDLWKHEYANHLCKSEKKSKTRRVQCSRCEYVSPRLNTTGNHFLRSHLILKPNGNTCSICQLFLTRKSSPSEVLPEVIKHFRTHHDFGEKSGVKYKCSAKKCPAFFQTEQQLFRHRKAVHRRPHQCLICWRGYKSESSLLSHQNFYHLKDEKWKKIRNSSSRDCPICGKLIKKFLLHNHLKVHKREENLLTGVKLRPKDNDLFTNPVYCSHLNCKKFYYKEEDLQTHLRLHGDFKCTFCPMVFDYAGKLAIHELTHSKNPEQSESEKRNFFCSRCSFSTTRRKHFICHFIETHLCMLADYQYCPICRAQFYCTITSFTEDLRRHLLNSHNITKKLYLCKELDCEAYFNTVYQLEIHGSVHKFDIKITSEGIRTWQCKLDGCKRSFISKAASTSHYYKYHRVQHDALSNGDRDKGMKEELKVMCNECGKILRNEIVLRFHVSKVHHKKPRKPTAKKTYVCDQCGKSFKDISHLQLHNYSHSGPESWKFECPTCSKRCLTKQKLDEHMRTHSKEKPFACEHCGISYAHRHNLRIHINNKHGNVGDDSARKFSNSRLASKKGIKSKLLQSQEGETSRKKDTIRRGRGRPRRKQTRSSSSFSGISDLSS